MDYKISKEVFEEVMNTKIKCFAIKSYRIEYGDDATTLKYIPIDTLYFKCKKWIVKSGYQIRIVNSWKDSNIKIAKFGEGFMDYHKQFTSEQQAVFDACEYIRKKGE